MSSHSEELVSKFESAMIEYFNTLTTVPGTSLADIFLAGFRQGLRIGRQDSYRALTKALEGLQTDEKAEV